MWSYAAQNLNMVASLTQSLTPFVLQSGMSISPVSVFVRYPVTGVGYRSLPRSDGDIAILLPLLT